MAQLNEVELDTLSTYADICIKALGIKYDIRDPFKVLKDFENGSTAQRYRDRRDAELDFIKRDIQGEFKKKKVHEVFKNSFSIRVTEIWKPTKKIAKNKRVPEFKQQ